MQLGQRGWLRAILEEETKKHTFDTQSPLAQDAMTMPSGPGQARRYLRGIFRLSGLLYGTPATRSALPGASPEERLFLAVLRTLCRICLDVGVLTQAPDGARTEQLLLLLAATFGRIDLADDIHQRVSRAGKQNAVPEKMWTNIENALEARAISLAGDPSYGLLLHNGAVYADGYLLGRLALAYFTRLDFSKETAERRVRFAAEQKALLVRVLVGLYCVGRIPSFSARRAMLRQIEDLHLPEDLADSVETYARKAFDKSMPLKKIIAPVRSHDMKRFIFEQTLLAALVEAESSEEQKQFVNQLGELLKFTPPQVEAVRLAVADFYARNRDVVDVFTVSSAAELMGEELVDTLQHKFQRNYRALQKQIRETGELSVLLSKAARGQKLSSDEKRQMRDQLIDVAKTIPAIAIFAAPGGLLLLVALAKVLPMKLLPTAFQPDANDEDITGVSHVVIRPELETNKKTADKTQE